MPAGEEGHVNYIANGSNRHSMPFCCSLPVEVLSIRKWAQLKDLEDKNLKRLAEGLPAIILQCKATSTTKNYLGGFKRWKQWPMIIR